jgi:hypothetical protein
VIRGRNSVTSFTDDGWKVLSAHVEGKMGDGEPPADRKAISQWAFQSPEGWKWVRRQQISSIPERDSRIPVL